jgi:hypothetical protein
MKHRGGEYTIVFGLGTRHFKATFKVFDKIRATGSKSKHE